MTIEITPTGRITFLDGVEVRVWEGVTGGDTRCMVYVHRLAVSDEEDTGAFERELEEQPLPADPPLMEAEAALYIDEAKKLLREKWPARVVEEAGMRAAVLSFFAGSLRAACDLFLGRLAEGHVDHKQVQMMRRYTKLLRRLMREADQRKASGTAADCSAAHEVSCVHVTTMNDPTTGRKMLCVDLEIGGEWRRVFSQWTRTVDDGIINEFISKLGIEKAPVVDITAFDAEPMEPTGGE